MIDIKIFEVTPLATNCCYLVDKETGKSAVVDPGEKSEKLINQINADGGKLEYVILTHGHFDHIGYAKELAEMFSAKIIIGEKDKDFLEKSELNLSYYQGIISEPFKADKLLSDGEEFNLGNTTIKYLLTPGHTKGSGVYIFDDTMISGDTLFCESYGRTDFPTGDNNMMIESLKKLKNLEGNYKVIPGHGMTTTLDHERKYNPIMRRI